MDVSLKLIPEFLAADECEVLIERMRPKLRPSSTTDQDIDPANYDKTWRTSRSCDLGLLGDVLVEALEWRMACAVRQHPSLSEGLQGQYYDVGQEFKPHCDYFEPRNLERFSSPTLGQRTTTLMVYLNTTERGGHTVFPYLGVSIRPQRGLAVVWNNLLDGKPNPLTTHHGTPVEAGFKAIVTKWFRLPRPLAAQSSGSKIGTLSAAHVDGSVDGAPVK